MGPERVPIGDDLLAEQLAYYRARAAEYDDWFFRRGRYDRGAAATASWFEEAGRVRDWLRALPLRGADVLELASGTGIWTEELVAQGARVTAVDAAPEMLAALRERLGDAVEVRGADLFAYAPERPVDAVVSCFFMSHVPDERFGAFAALVAGALRPGGAYFLCDSLRTPSSTAADHALPEGDDPTMLRRLDDGRTYRIVKRFRTDAELASALRGAGLDVEVRRTPTYFQVALGTRPASRQLDQDLLL